MSKLRILHFGTRLRLSGLSAALLLVAVPNGAAAEYRLERGDVVAISVFGTPELTRPAAVNIDGQISIPLIGLLPVAGLSLAEVQTKLGELLQMKNIVRAPRVAVEVVEYRPFYIRGDVANSGSYPFRPGLTVRQAVALAGGYGLLATGGNNAALGAVDLRSEYNALWTELIYGQARLDRLRAELDGKEKIDLTPSEDGPTAPDVVSNIAQLETRQLEAHRADQDKTLKHLKVVLGYTQNQLSALEQQQKEAEKSVALQSEELNRARALFGKGFTTSTRLTDEQTALALVKTQLLENIAEAAGTRRLLEEFDRKMEEIVDQRQIELLNEIQETVVNLEKTRVRLEAAREKLIFTGETLSQPLQGPTVLQDVVVFRKVDDQQSQLIATEDTELAPGDIVEVKRRQSIPPLVSSTIQAPAHNKMVTTSPQLETALPKHGSTPAITSAVGLQSQISGPR